MSTAKSVIETAKKQGAKLADAFRLKGDVFPKDFLEMWVSHKRKKHDALRIHPHPCEFFLYYNV